MKFAQRLAALVCFCFLAACGTTQVGTTAAADCDLPDADQQVETVTPLPEDHDLPVGEVWDILRAHALNEKQVVDRSNDKTTFVNANCRPGHKALPAPAVGVPAATGPAKPLPVLPNSNPWWKVW